MKDQVITNITIEYSIKYHSRSDMPIVLLTYLSISELPTVTIIIIHGKMYCS